MMKQAAVVGSRAPDFSLICTSGQESERHQIRLADYQDRWLMLLFYPRDFSLV
jgi:peroxiredoxin